MSWAKWSECDELGVGSECMHTGLRACPWVCHWDEDINLRAVYELGTRSAQVILLIDHIQLIVTALEDTLFNSASHTYWYGSITCRPMTSLRSRVQS